ncbi:MAG: LacI family DNA-binding transcriptional regulator [Actinomycetota bacterium]|nr:LacI family DNA-binding transcriptional regulator [Actinomycetota bacterium]
MATLRDVAEAAGVSVATVSNVFNGTGRMSPAVRLRVLDAAAGLGYAGPNAAAASLRRGSAGILGVVFGEGLRYSFDDPAASAFLAGVGDVSEDSDVGLTLLPLPPRSGGSGPARGLGALARAVIDGALVYSLEEDHPALSTLLARALPLVAVDGPTDVSGPPWAGLVLVSDRAAAQDAAEHVIGLGHRRAAVLVDRLTARPRVGAVGWDEARTATSSVMRERMLGYTDAWAAAGLPPEELTVNECGANTAAAGEDTMRELLRGPHPPTAVLAISDVLAVGAARAARAAGLAVPAQLSVVGFDDGPVAALHDPPLTTVRQPLREKGRQAARMLLDALKGAPDGGRRVLPAELVVRDSTAPAP